MFDSDQGKVLRLYSETMVGIFSSVHSTEQGAQDCRIGTNLLCRAVVMATVIFAVVSHGGSCHDNCSSNVSATRVRGHPLPMKEIIPIQLPHLWMIASVISSGIICITDFTHPIRLRDSRPQ